MAAFLRACIILASVMQLIGSKMKINEAQQSMALSASTTATPTIVPLTATNFDATSSGNGITFDQTYLGEAGIMQVNTGDSFAKYSGNLGGQHRYYEVTYAQTTGHVHTIFNAGVAASQSYTGHWELKNSGGDGGYYMLMMPSDTMYASDGLSTTAVSSNYVADQWNTMAFEISSSEVKGFVNGRSVGTISSSSSFANPDAWLCMQGSGYIYVKQFCTGTGAYTNTSCQALATAVGDPHLQNMHGKKFDVHDGLHRLVHFPRGSSESEALLKIDADASMMPGETSCYNVYFQSAKLSGKWLGDEVLLQHDNASMGRKKFVLGMHGNLRDWSAVEKDAANLKFSGTEPIKVSTLTRNASADTPGGDAVEFTIGHEHPVRVQVWASHGDNELTDGQDIQFLNLEVQNLPENTGGLLGLDAYTRPAGSKCGLTQQETGSIDSIHDLLTSFVQTKATEKRKLQWHISAQAREHS